MRQLEAPSTELSLIIPWVHMNTDKEYIKEIINDLDCGNIYNIDMVFINKSKTHSGKINPRHYKVYVNIDNLTESGIDMFKKLNTTEMSVDHFYGKWVIKRANIKYRKKTTYKFI